MHSLSLVPWWVDVFVGIPLLLVLVKFIKAFIFYGARAMETDVRCLLGFHRYRVRATRERGASVTQLHLNPFAGTLRHCPRCQCYLNNLGDVSAAVMEEIQRTLVSMPNENSVLAVDGLIQRERQAAARARSAAAIARAENRARPPAAPPVGGGRSRAATEAVARAARPAPAPKSKKKAPGKAKDEPKVGRTAYERLLDEDEE